MKKKILSLNLVLLMLAMMVQPVSAGQYDAVDYSDVIDNIAAERGSMVEAPDEFTTASDAADDTLTQYKDIVNNIGSNDNNVSTYSNTTAYDIWVESEHFMSDTDASGKGWTYKADENKLTLDNCFIQDTAIRASGDLTVYAKGKVDIMADRDSKMGFGYDGIETDGFLTLYAAGDELSIWGGDGIVRYGVSASYAKGGNAITARGGFLGVFVSGETILYGGENSEGTTVKLGTFGIYAPTVQLTSQNKAKVKIHGGSNYNTSSDSTAGVGIIAARVSIEAESYISAGERGTCSAPGIFFSESCEFGAVNSEVAGSSGIDGRAYAIQNPDDNKPRYSIHTTVTDKGYNVKTAVKKYTFKLIGNGGYTSNGNTQLSFTDYYPASYQLSKYVFERTGYTQIGWNQFAGMDDLSVPLNDVYTPTSPSQLTAYWAKTNKGEVLLNCLEGQFSDGKCYKNYGNKSVELPESLLYSGNKLMLLGWSDEPDSDPAENDSYVYAGKWYAGGTTVDPDSSKTTVMYGRAADNGVIYHPMAGILKNGGNIIVQGLKGTLSTDKTVQVIGQEKMNAPAGYEFAGWSVSEDSDVVKYKPGDEITLKKGALYNLYAVWDKTSYTYSPENGVTVTYRPDDKNISIELTSEWCSKNSVSNSACALYRNGKQISAAAQKYSSGTNVKLSMDYTGSDDISCSIFTADTKWKPTRQPITFSITDVKE